MCPTVAEAMEPGSSIGIERTLPTISQLKQQYTSGRFIKRGYLWQSPSVAYTYMYACVKSPCTHHLVISDTGGRCLSHFSCPDFKYQLREGWCQKRIQGFFFFGGGGL